ncbi:MAG TPA: alpha/beta hydrolase [Caulobacteraceae bacterium]|jgi:acetyl esterase/lipase|nr:alpha/beta hydrolase [Caulobacteraceae bacterium]
MDRRSLVALAAALGLSGCTGFDVVNTLQPAVGTTVAHDLAYGSDPRQRVDVYRPSPARGPAPVVVFVYGGGWDSGSKADYRFAGNALARQGFVTVVPDYRVYPQVRWPAFVEDTAAAVAWTRAHAGEFGGDPQRVFLMGHSAGAYNVVMLAVDRRWLAAVGMDPKRDLRGVVGLAGPYDFLPVRTDELKAIFGPQDRRSDTQPIDHVDGANPPLFLATDSADKVVDPGNTTRMAAKVRAAGGPVEVKVYRGLSHALLMGAVAAPLRLLAPVLKDSVDFMRAHDVGAAPGPGPGVAR